MPLNVLVVDDELPIREELSYLLGRDSRIGEVHSTGSGAAALKELERGDVDAVFLDIAMPGLSGLDVARVLARFRHPPAIVFVTAHEEHALEAFEVNATDYLLKPVHEDRVQEAIRRIVDSSDHPPELEQDDERIPVELAGVTRFVRRGDVMYVEAQGDYVRLHTATGSHLVRTPLTTLEESWRPHGFVRIHRSRLVATRHIRELRIDHGRCTVLVGDEELQVSRRHTPQLRDLLVRQPRPATGRGDA